MKCNATWLKHQLLWFIRRPYRKDRRVPQIFALVLLSFPRSRVIKISHDDEKLRGLKNKNILIQVDEEKKEESICLSKEWFVALRDAIFRYAKIRIKPTLLENEAFIWTPPVYFVFYGRAFGNIRRWALMSDDIRNELRLELKDDLRNDLRAAPETAVNDH